MATRTQEQVAAAAVGALGLVACSWLAGALVGLAVIGFRWVTGL